MTDHTKRNVIEWGWAAVKGLLPIIMIGWYASQTISRIEQKTLESIDKVAQSVNELRTAELVHEKTDDQRQVVTDHRLDRVESKQDGLEQTLNAYGVSLLVNTSRRPKVDARQGTP